MKYTVRQATATGKVDPKFGSEYIVHFNEDEREVKLSRQKPVVVGQEENGTIIDGKYGAYFKKDPFVPAAGGGNATPVAEPATKQAWVPKKDNSDGQRQGMCINNAAAYIASWGTNDMTAETWAKEVHSYAAALYALSDLSVPATVASVFAGAEAE